jgi:hypothetical protein
MRENWSAVGAGWVGGKSEPLTIPDDFAFPFGARPGACIPLGHGGLPGSRSPNTYWNRYCRQPLGSGAAA